jgi:hypothetical protein
LTRPLRQAAQVDFSGQDYATPVIVAQVATADWGAVDEVFYGCANQAGEDNRNVARMAKLRKIPVARVHHRQLGQDGNAVIALLAPRNDIAVAKRSKSGERHLVDRAFAFLQTQDIRLFLGQKPRHQTFAQADGIDVPGGKGKGHRHLLLRRTLGNRP